MWENKPSPLGSSRSSKGSFIVLYAIDIFGCRKGCKSYNLLIYTLYCGESGIRTRETLLAFTHFPGVPLQPLEHLSLVLSLLESSAKINIVRQRSKSALMVMLPAPSTHKAALVSLVCDSLAMKIGQGEGPQSALAVSPFACLASRCEHAPMHLGASYHPSLGALRGSPRRCEGRQWGG